MFPLKQIHTGISYLQLHQFKFSFLFLQLTDTESCRNCIIDIVFDLEALNDFSIVAGM